MIDYLVAMNPLLDETVPRTFFDNRGDSPELLASEATSLELGDVLKGAGRVGHPLEELRSLLEYHDPFSATFGEPISLYFLGLLTK